MGTATTFCITTCTEFLRRSRKLERGVNSVAACRFLRSASSSVPFSVSGSFELDSCNRTRFASVLSVATPVSMKVNASSTVGAPSNNLDASSTGAVGANDLLIVGPGVLGRMVAEKWREEHPGSQICGQTRTIDHHDELINMGITPSLKENQPNKFPYVMFCAPPYGNPDYPGEVREATLNWNGKGSFLFTSSSATFDCSDNGACDEHSPDLPLGRSPRADTLLKAEKVVLEAGGCVLRLAGLYLLNRGPHSFWLEKGTSDLRPDHFINLIHYEDAASLSIAILKKNLRGGVFLGCDNHPLSRQELMELVNQSGKYSKKFEGFTGTSDPLGKSLNNSKTRDELGWEPKYPSFAQFLESA